MDLKLFFLVWWLLILLWFLTYRKVSGWVQRLFIYSLPSLFTLSCINFLIISLYIKMYVYIFIHIHVQHGDYSFKKRKEKEILKKGKKTENIMPSASKYFSVYFQSTRTSSYIGTGQWSKAGNETLMQYYHLTHIKIHAFSQYWPL